jgi:hypothetical protein
VAALLQRRKPECSPSHLLHGSVAPQLCAGGDACLLTALLAGSSPAKQVLQRIAFTGHLLVASCSHWLLTLMLGWHQAFGRGQAADLWHQAGRPLCSWWVVAGPGQGTSL